MTTAAIYGCLGPQLTMTEAAFFRDSAPWGFILFARNIETPEQVSKLCADLREAVGWHTPILIDQEGGRVQRLRPPHWRKWPAVLDLCNAINDEKTLIELLLLRYRVIADELHQLGIDVDCMPLLDVPVAGAHDIIGDRALGNDPKTIARRGKAICDGLLQGGVLPVIKHIPGHGRANVDSHLDLPLVEANLSSLQKNDFAPFKDLNNMPLAMTAHVIYTAIDAECCATVSAKIIHDVLRTEIGYDGALMSDDLSMHALKGTFETRAQDAIAAGCDLLLHCNGDPIEMTKIAANTPKLSNDSLRRTNQALEWRKTPEPFDKEEALFKLSAAEDLITNG